MRMNDSMADSTKDIWNDSPEEEQKKPKRQGLKRVLTFLLILIAVLAVVLVAAYRDGTGMDALQRLFNYGKSDAVNGETVYDILREAAVKNKIHLETNGNADTAYVEGINNIYEFDFGDLSGWTYFVNGSRLSLGCGEYKLAPNDKIEWVYSIEMNDDWE